MKDLVEFIVENPDKVMIKSENKNNIEVITVKASKKDLGKVIGKHGKNIKALRTIIKSVYARKGERATLEVEE